MSPNAGTELVPLDSLLTGSEKTVWEISANGDVSSFPIWIIICAVLSACLVFSRKLSPFMEDVLSFVPKQLHDGDRRRPFSEILTLIFVGLFSSAILSGSLCFIRLFPSSAFLHLLWIFITVLTIRSLLLLTIGNVSDTPCIISFVRASILLFFAISLLSIISATLLFLFPSALGNNVLFYSLAISIICMTLAYLFKVMLTLFYSGTSPFYSFLYLCTFEIIPFCIIAVLFSRL